MERIILGSVTGNIIHMMEDYLPKPFNEMRLAVVPTAANGETGDTSWLNREIKQFSDQGFQVFLLELEGKSEVELREECKDIDAIFVAGGNTYYLLHHVRLSGFDKIVSELIQRDVVYIGSSAGALLACPSIDVARRFDDPSVVSLDSYDGLGLVDFIVIPHIDAKKHAPKFKDTIEEWKDKPYQLIGLTDYQVLVKVGNYMEIASLEPK